VERGTCLAAASQLNCLGALGLTAEQLQSLQEWAAQGSAVSLRFKSKESCAYLREETREEEEPRKHVTEKSVGGVLRSAITSKVVTKITEYFWNFEAAYSLEAFRGVGADTADRIVLASHTGAVELKTTTKSPAPYPEARAPAINQEVNITWLITALNEAAVPNFQINRASPGCKTPRRNEEVQKAFHHFTAFADWTQYVAGYFHHLRTVQPQKPDESLLSGQLLFMPVLPLLIKEGSAPDTVLPEVDRPGLLAQLSPAKAGDVSPGGYPDASRDAVAQIPGPVFSINDGNLLLSEELRTLKEHAGNIEMAFPLHDGIVTAAEVHMVAVVLHCLEVATAWKGMVDYVEGMLRQQLIAAIGKEVSPSDFSAYMRFHYRKLFLEAYQPKPFCFSVRRSPKHSPEGTVSIDEDSAGGGDGNIRSPIVTLSHCSASPVTMSFDLSASTTIAFSGNIHLHGYLSHSFSGQSGSKLFLESRAKQFSSMIVLVGRVTSATTFDPSYAAIIQNKDEISIPLELSVIPTAKEFKDAISSLSPEQQAFAKAFRAMQLESTLFGVLVVQIKPQLEKLLNLADDSLTKEIKLTQDIMELLLKYQIPSDLLSFPETAEAAPGSFAPPARPPERTSAVKGHVKAMFDMIEEEKLKELEERRREAEFMAPVLQSPCGWGADDDAMHDMQMLADECMVEKKEERKEERGDQDKKRKKKKETKGGRASKEGESHRGEAAEATQESIEQEPKDDPEPPHKSSSGSGPGATRDYTQVPQEMDEQFEKMDPDSTLRPTIINPGSQWTKRSQKSLLAPPSTESLCADDQKREKDAAFDLLDAITKSGAMELSHASLHIVIAATHCFDKTVTESAIQDNVNPIEKVERSSLIMASTIHQEPVKALITAGNVERIVAASPRLFLADEP